MPKPLQRLVLIVVLVLVVLALLNVYVSRRPQTSGGPGGMGAGSAPVPVVTRAVESRPLAVEVEGLGTTRANESIDVTAKLTNTVMAVRFTEGAWVNAGAVLVELDGAQAQADLAAAEASLAESRSAHTRSRDLFAQKALSQAQLEQIEATLKGNEARVLSAQARANDTVIRAPFAGRVGLRRVSVGALVSAGAVITTLDDTRTMKLDFEVPETFMTVLVPGLAISATSVAYPGEVFRGEVQSVDSRVDPVTRSIRVRARLPNGDNRLRPGMFLTVLVQREPSPALVVPEQALVPERGRTYVFVLAEGKVSRREVTVGRRSPGLAELLSGVSEGERVVVEGTQKVREGVTAEEAPAASAAG